MSRALSVEVVVVIALLAQPGAVEPQPLVLCLAKELARHLPRARRRALHHLRVARAPARESPPMLSQLLRAVAESFLLLYCTTLVP